MIVFSLIFFQEQGKESKWLKKQTNKKTPFIFHMLNKTTYISFLIIFLFVQLTNMKKRWTLAAPSEPDSGTDTGPPVIKAHFLTPRDLDL